MWVDNIIPKICWVRITIFLIAVQVLHKVGASYDCDKFKQQCETYCGVNSVSSFTCEPNSVPRRLVSSLSFSQNSIFQQQDTRGGSHSCTCQQTNVDQCQEYTDFCSQECGGSSFVKEFTCTLEQISDDNTLGSSKMLQMECQCQEQIDDASPLEDISITVVPPPAKAASGTSDLVQAFTQSQQISTNGAYQCYDYLPTREGTCADRIAWGSCEESWMREKYFCARSCGFCDDPESQEHDCYTEYYSCSQVCGGEFDFACYRTEKKSDCVCIQSETTALDQEDVAMGTNVGVSLVVDGSNNDCNDYTVAKRGSCQDRTDLNSQRNNNKGDEWLSAHNKFRQNHCVQNLKWSSTLAEEADKMASECGLVENDQRSWNYYKQVGSMNSVSASEIVSSWYSIGINNGLDFQNPEFSTEVAPTLKVIWRSSIYVGCSKQECGGEVYAYCLYDPPGNLLTDNIQDEVAIVCD
eukprot:TRINITY_DN4527_c0_g1_i12.p1 TRINITY_DN4527_c0_g1~~TRINITY_DN4527_c0_g1_i12.p1  ORF type:complete len:467 (-),score=57.70 TRINITY_DN4527_c0_g1_i12:431-1831(-)